MEHNASNTGSKKVRVSGRYPSSTMEVSDSEGGEERPTGQKMAKKKGKERNDQHATFMEINERKVSALKYWWL